MSDEQTHETTEHETTEHEKVDPAPSAAQPPTPQTAEVPTVPQPTDPAHDPVQADDQHPQPGGTPPPASAASAVPPVPSPAQLAQTMTRPGPRPAATPAPPAATPSAAARRFGRVAEDGTVYVRTDDGEREVGSYPGATPDEALAYFGRKYDEIVAQADLFEQRLGATDIPVGEIDSGLAKLRSAVTDLRAVGDLAALAARVKALGPVAAERRRQAEAVRTAARDEARARRTALVEEAERLSETPADRIQWRADGQRMKDLFETWQAEQKASGSKGEPGAVRLDRRSEDELWKRFSHARTAFDRKRRNHFAHLDEQRAEALTVKEKLVQEAEALAPSQDWAATAQAFKRLMDRWRVAGRAARKDDDELWERFRAAQDTFFAARNAVQAEQDAEFTANLQVKEALLVEAERLLPITDLSRAKAALRDLQDRWEAAGKVPRGDVDRVERRIRAVEQAVREQEDARWRQTNPEAQARARSAVDQLERAISDLQEELSRAQEQSKPKRVAEVEASLVARRQWLEQAQRALADFGG